MLRLIGIILLFLLEYLPALKNGVDEDQISFWRYRGSIYLIGSVLTGQSRVSPYGYATGLNHQYLILEIL